MAIPAPSSPASDVQVGILVLNYHHASESLDCVRSLLAREPDSTRILWIENDAALTWATSQDCLEASGLSYRVVDPGTSVLPPSGTVGVILSPENLGFAGGNNLGLAWLHRLAVPFAWVLNNDTLILSGNSEVLVAAAEARPEVGAWGTPIVTSHLPCYFGGIVSKRDFSIQFAKTPECLETDPLSYVSGCSLFFRTSVAAAVGFIPEHYFLYYEDPALGLELRKAGYSLSGVWGVLVFHLESLSTGRRSPLMEYYNRRNRWFFIQRYFPDQLAHQKWQIWYRLQKWAFRARFDRIRIEILAFLDFRQGRLGRTHRVFSRRLSK